MPLSFSGEGGGANNVHNGPHCLGMGMVGPYELHHDILMVFMKVRFVVSHITASGNPGSGSPTASEASGLEILGCS